MNKLQTERLKAIVEMNYKLMDEAQGDQNEAFELGLLTVDHEGQAVYDLFHDESLRFPVDPVEYYGEDNVKKMLSVPAWSALETGWCQARVIRDIAPFKQGDSVDMDLIENDMVAVWETKYETPQDCIAQGGRYEEYNLDTHEDYDKYFRVY